MTCLINFKKENLFRIHLKILEGEGGEGEEEKKQGKKSTDKLGTLTKITSARKKFKLSPDNINKKSLS